MRNQVAAFVLLTASTLATMGGLLAKGQGPEAAPPKTTTRTKTTVRATPRGDRPELAVAPGWAWLMPPQELRPGLAFGQTSDDGIVSGYSHVDAEGGGLRFFFVQAGPAPRNFPPTDRLVVFDADGRRYLPKRVKAGGLGNRDTDLSEAIFRLGPEVLPPGKAAYIAAERVPNKAR